MQAPGTVVVDGTTISVHDLGGSGPLTLLAHATGFHGRTLRPVARALAQHLHGFAPDFRGHGMSGVPDGLDFRWDGFARDLLATADLLRPEGSDSSSRERRTIPLLYGIGHSMGATALLLAEATRPGTFAALYCYEPILLQASERLPVGTANALSDAARRRRAVFASRAEAVERYRSRPPLSSLDRAVLDEYVEHGFAERSDGSIELRCPPPNEALVYEGGFACDAFDHLSAVRCPVTIAFGTASEDIGRIGLPRALERLSQGHMAALDGLGHFGPLEAPSAVASSVLQAFGATTA